MLTRHRYKIVGWTVRPCEPEKNGGFSVRFDVHFESAEESVDWDKVVRLPTAEETDDYKMYKIIHREQRALKQREAHSIFEASTTSEEDYALGAATRSMSISKVVGLPPHKGNLDDSGSPSDSDHWEDSKNAVDGSSDNTHSPWKAIHKRRPAYVPDVTDLETQSPQPHTSRLLREALAFTAVEPFASLRRRLAPHRNSYDGSEDAEPNQLIDTRFRPVHWNAPPKSPLTSAFGLSYEELNKIAPFSDFQRRRSSVETTFVSPKSSVADFRAKLRTHYTHEHSPRVSIIAESAVDDETPTIVSTAQTPEAGEQPPVER
jgi:hypothetical protein